MPLGHALAREKPLVVSVVAGKTIAALAVGMTALGFVVVAGEVPSEEYVEAMKTLQVVADGLGPAIEAGDHEAMLEYVVMARPALLVNETYWFERDEEPGVEAAKAASKAVAELSVAVHLMSLSPNPIAQEGARQANETFLGACVTCHEAHREELPDGTYRIK